MKNLLTPFGIKDIPKRKPRDYPENFKRWEWIGDVIYIHAVSKRVWGKKILTFEMRTPKGRAQTFRLLKKRFPYAFAKF